MPISPADLKEYSTFEAVQIRPDPQLKMDILEAKTYINGLIEPPLSEYQELPAELELAMLKVAQFYALVNGDESIVKGYKSEKIGDYSYTLADGSSMTMPDVSGLLADFIPVDEEKTEGFFLRMRSI
jgi:hypothetical protein